jgi:hypothetical protein
MSGRDLAREATALRPGMKVLFTSGFMNTALEEATQLMPGDAFIGKPYRQHELARKLREVLDRR